MQYLPSLNPEWSDMRELPGVFVRSLQKRLNFALFAAGHDPACKGLRMGRLCAWPSCRSRQFLVNLDVVESAKSILQARQTSLKVGQTLSRSAAEHVPEKIAGIAKLLDRDPQLVALLAIKLSDLFRFLPYRLGTTRENIRSEPFYWALFTMPRLLWPSSGFEPLQCIE
jgi:hypothetical protein